MQYNRVSDTKETKKKKKRDLIGDRNGRKERRKRGEEIKKKKIHEYMETICTDRKKNHVARRTLRAYSALSCEENREKIMSMDSGVVARGGKHTASHSALGHQQ